MRLWSLAPRYLDRAGLTACWREALLAQAVLAGETRGYRHHPQLVRFAAHPDPLAAIGAYLVALHDESCARGYCYDAGRIRQRASTVAQIPVTTGQLTYEQAHLRAKLGRRDPDRVELLGADPHPLFYVVPGEVEPWERR